MIRLNQPYKCRHCKTVYVILPGRWAWSFLPVEVITGNEIYDAEFDKTKHVPHLKKCPQLQAQWEGVKKQILDQIKNNEKYAVKELLR